MATAGNRLENLWDDARASAMSESEKLLYRSNLLGSDKRVTNYGGGNTSAKVMERDPLTGQMVEVLWVKGSGGDIGSMKMDGFSTLYMNKLQALKGLYRGLAYEDEMVGYLPHCTFNLNPRAASIDTPLHAFVPMKHVDHVHSDAIIAIAASVNSRALTAEIFGDSIGWLPWKRPGFELGLWLEKFAMENPQARGCVLESHGLFTWADDAKDCYLTTLDVINTAAAWLEAKTAGKPAFGGQVRPTLAAEERRAVADDVVVVGTASGIDEEKTVAVCQPVLLRVVAAEFRAVVEVPGLWLGKVQSVITHTDVAALVIAQREVVAATKSNQRRLVKPTRYVEAEYIAVPLEDELLAIEAAFGHGRAESVLGAFADVERHEQLSVAVHHPLCAGIAGKVKLLSCG